MLLVIVYVYNFHTINEFINLTKNGKVVKKKEGCCKNKMVECFTNINIVCWLVG